jgi:biopolymer transport protein ExbD
MEERGFDHINVIPFLDVLGVVKTIGFQRISPETREKI